MFSTKKKRVRRVRKTSRQRIKNPVNLHVSILRGKEKKTIYFPTFSVIKKTLIFLMIGLLVIPFCKLSAESTYVFFTEDCFIIKRVDVENNLLFSKDEVRNLAQVNKGENIWDIDLEKIKHRLEKSRNIEKVIVSRRIPGTVLLKVYERIPNLVVRDAGKEIFADKEGYILSWGNKRVKSDLPVIEGVAVGKRRRVELLETLYAICENYAYSDKLRDNFGIQKIEYVNEFEINLTINESKIVRITKEDNFNRKFLRLKDVLTDLEKKDELFKTIDLRFNDVIVN